MLNQWSILHFKTMLISIICICYMIALAQLEKQNKSLTRHKQVPFTM